MCDVLATREHLDSPEHKDQYQKIYGALDDVLNRRRRAQQEQNVAASYPAADDDAQTSKEKKCRLCDQSWHEGFAEGFEEGKRKFGAGAMGTTLKGGRRHL
jgi:hypothetical protein